MIGQQSRHAKQVIFVPVSYPDAIPVPVMVSVISYLHGINQWLAISTGNNLLVDPGYLPAFAAGLSTT